MKTETVILAGAALAGVYLLTRPSTQAGAVPTPSQPQQLPQIIALPSGGQQQGFSLQDVTALFSSMKAQASPATVISLGGALGGAAQTVAQIPSIKEVTEYALDQTYRMNPAFSGSGIAQRIADLNQTDPAKALGLLTQWATDVGNTTVQNIINDAKNKVGAGVMSLSVMPASKILQDAKQKLATAADAARPNLPDVVYYEEQKTPFTLGGAAGAASQMIGAGAAGFIAAPMLSKVPQTAPLGALLGVLGSAWTQVTGATAQSYMNIEKFKSQFPAGTIFKQQGG